MGNVHNITIAWSEDFECFEDVRWFLDGDSGRTGNSLYMVLRKRTRVGVPSYRVMKIGGYKPADLASLPGLDGDLEEIRRKQKGRGKIVVRHGSPCRDDETRASSVEIACLPRALIEGIRPPYNDIDDEAGGRRLHFNITNIGMYLPLRRCIDTGVSHPYVFTLSKRNIGSIRDEIDDHVGLLRHDWWYSNEAISLARHALELAESAFGTDSLKIVWYLKKLGFIYIEQKQYDDAELLYRRALDILERNNMGESRDAYTVLCNFAGVLFMRGRLAEAEVCETRAMELAIIHYGPADADSAKTMLNLARIYWEQDRYDQAAELYRQGMAILEGDPTSRSADIQQGLQSMARMYEDNVEYERAAECLKRALALKADRLGYSDSDVVKDVIYFGQRLEFWEENEEAEHLYMGWIRDLEREGKGESVSAAQLYCRLAELYLERGMYRMAELTCARAIETARGIPGGGGQYPEVEALAVQSKIFIVRGKHREALDALEQARESAFATGLAERIQGKIIRFHVNRARDFADDGDLQSAEASCQAAIREISDAVRDTPRLETWFILLTSVLDDLSGVCRSLKKPAEARELLKLSRKLWNRVQRDVDDSALELVDGIAAIFDGREKRSSGEGKKSDSEFVITRKPSKPIFPGILPSLPEHTSVDLQVKSDKKRMTESGIRNRDDAPHTTGADSPKEITDEVSR